MAKVFFLYDKNSLFLKDQMRESDQNMYYYFDNVEELFLCLFENHCDLLVIYNLQLKDQKNISKELMCIFELIPSLSIGDCTLSIYQLINEELEKQLFLEKKNISTRLLLIEKSTSADTAKELISIFCNQFFTNIQQLQQHLLNLDQANLKFLAHNLKSSSANIGALRLPIYFSLLEGINGFESDFYIKLLISIALGEYRKVIEIVNIIL